jgi:hypothetical protein
MFSEERPVKRTSLPYSGDSPTIVASRAKNGAFIRLENSNALHWLLFNPSGFQHFSLFFHLYANY